MYRKFQLNWTWFFNNIEEFILGFTFYRRSLQTFKLQIMMNFKRNEIFLVLKVLSKLNMFFHFGTLLPWSNSFQGYSICIRVTYSIVSKGVKAPLSKFTSPFLRFPTLWWFFNLPILQRFAGTKGYFFHELRFLWFMHTCIYSLAMNLVIVGYF